MADNGSSTDGDLDASSHDVDRVTISKPLTQETATQISNTEVAINVQSLVVEIQAPNPILPTDAFLKPFITPSKKKKKNAFDPYAGYKPEPTPFEPRVVMSSKVNPFVDHQLPPEPRKPKKPILLPVPLVPGQYHVNADDSLELPRTHRKHEYITVGCLFDLPRPKPITDVGNQGVVWPRQEVRTRIPEIVGNSPVIPLKNSRIPKGNPRKCTMERPQPSSWIHTSGKPIGKPVELQPAPGRTDIYMSASDEHMTIHYTPKPKLATIVEEAASDALNSANVGELESSTKDSTVPDSVTTGNILEPESKPQGNTASDSPGTDKIEKSDTITKGSTVSGSDTNGAILKPKSKRKGNRVSVSTETDDMQESGSESKREYKTTFDSTIKTLETKSKENIVLDSSAAYSAENLELNAEENIASDSGIGTNASINEEVELNVLHTSVASVDSDELKVTDDATE